MACRGARTERIGERTERIEARTERIGRESNVGTGFSEVQKSPGCSAPDNERGTGNFCDNFCDNFRDAFRDGPPAPSTARQKRDALHRLSQKAQAYCVEQPRIIRETFTLTTASMARRARLCPASWTKSSGFLSLSFSVNSMSALFISNEIATGRLTFASALLRQQ